MRDPSAFFFTVALSAMLPLTVVNAQTTDSPKARCSPPRVIHREDPKLPSHFKSTSIATLNVVIDEKGDVSDATILKSSGDDEFDRNAVKAMKKWKFKPSLCDGKPTAVDISVEMGN